MTKERSISITRERLGLWEKRLTGEPFSATPTVLVSVCHDSPNQGRIVISVTEDLSDELVCRVLRGAASMIEEAS